MVNIIIISIVLNLEQWKLAQKSTKTNGDLNHAQTSLMYFLCIDRTLLLKALD